MLFKCLIITGIKLANKTLHLNPVKLIMTNQHRPYGTPQDPRTVKQFHMHRRKKKNMKRNYPQFYYPTTFQVLLPQEL